MILDLSGGYLKFNTGQMTHQIEDLPSFGMF